MTMIPIRLNTESVFEISFESKSFSLAAFCFILVSCAAPVTQTVDTTPEIPITAETVVAPEELAIPIITQPVVKQIKTVTIEAEKQEPVALPSIPAWEHLQVAQNDTGQRVTQLLATVNQLLEENRTTEAMEIFDLIFPYTLSSQNQVPYFLTQARIEQSRQRHSEALRLLEANSENTRLTADQRVQLLHLKIRSLEKLNSGVPLAIELMRLHSLTADDSELIRIGHRIWAVLHQIPFDHLTLALSEVEDSIARGWILLALAVNVVSYDPNQVIAAVDKWLAEYPNHPAGTILSTGILPDLETQLSSLRRVALLLPLTSENSTAAHAFLDGFNAQYDLDSNPFKPEVEVYDIGSEPGLANLYYDQAITAGAQFIVGPLGTSTTQELAVSTDLTVPTLLIGNTDSTDLPQHVYQFALTPEQDGVQVAQRAMQDGHSTAIVIYPPDRRSERVVSAFETEWTNQGGTVLTKQMYALNQPEYSSLLEKILNVNESEARYYNVRALLGQSFEHIARRRDDIDFIFLVADPVHGRILKPHIDFLKAHKVPVYSTSQIFTGALDAVNDRDINNVTFSDVPWLVESSDALEIQRKKFETPWTTANALDRIFAMGVDSYNLMYRVALLRDIGEARYHGVTARLQIGPKRKIIRESAWVMFEDGQLTTLSPNIFDLSPAVRGNLVSGSPSRPSERQ